MEREERQICPCKRPEGIGVGGGDISPFILNPGVRMGERSASRPGRFAPEDSPRYKLKGRLGGSSAGLDPQS